MGLEITTTRPQLYIERRPPMLQAEQPPGDLQIQRGTAELSIEREPLQIHVDSSECWAERGMKYPSRFSQECADLGNQAMLDCIARISTDGDTMMRIETGGEAGTVFAELSDAVCWKELSFNVDVVPKSRPKIEFTGVQSAKINWQIRPAQIAYTAQKPKTNWTPGNLRVNWQPPFPQVKTQYIDTRA